MRKQIKEILESILKENPELLADSCMYYWEVGEITSVEYREYEKKYRALKGQK